MIKIIYDKDNNKVVCYDNNIIIGECIFIENDNYINIIHTYVKESYRGHGIAHKLVDKVISIAKDNNKSVIADCSYAKGLLNK